MLIMISSWFVGRQLAPFLAIILGGGTVSLWHSDIAILRGHYHCLIRATILTFFLDYELHPSQSRAHRVLGDYLCLRLCHGRDVDPSP